MKRGIWVIAVMVIGCAQSGEPGSWSINGPDCPEYVVDNQNFADVVVYMNRFRIMDVHGLSQKSVHSCKGMGSLDTMVRVRAIGGDFDIYLQPAGTAIAEPGSVFEILVGAHPNLSYAIALHGAR